MLYLLLFFSANYGINFSTRQTEAFAVFNVFKNLGYVVEFSHGNLSCIRTKLYILIVFLVVGGICFVVLQHYYSTDDQHTEEDEINGKVSFADEDDHQQILKEISIDISKEE